MTRPRNQEWSEGAAGPVIRLTDADPHSLVWQDYAACAETDPEAFFVEKGGSTRNAKKICAGCFVRSQCLEDALEREERYGVWGGMSERERRRLLREQGAA